MSEWWTYSLHDFLLFSPRTYYRLIERYNADVWPAQVVAVLGVLLVAVTTFRRTRGSARIAAFVLASAWAWVAYGFLWERYATVNWSATYVAAAFVVEAVLWLVVGLAPIRESASATGDALRGRAFDVRMGVGWAMVAASIAYPVLALVTGRALHAGEVVGLMPDPTALATLGFVLLRMDRRGGWLLPVPVAWSVYSGATLWAMDAPEALLLPFAAVVSVLLAAMPRGGRPRGDG